MSIEIKEYVGAAPIIKDVQPEEIEDAVYPKTKTGKDKPKK